MMQVHKQCYYVTSKGTQDWIVLDRAGSDMMKYDPRYTMTETEG